MNGKHFVMASLISVILLAVVFTQISSQQGVGDYDPWIDMNDDGKIDIRDIATVARKFGAEGEPFVAKAALEYDSGWVDITNKAGQYFNITHNLNSTNIIVDIQGKTTLDGGVHQRHLGGTGYNPGWSKTYGGANNDRAGSVIQTVDGGYAIAGYTSSFGAGGEDFWLVKTDAAGNVQWNRTYGGASTDYASSVVQTNDGGYAIMGTTNSFGAGLSDVWLVKTDANGNMVWNKTYGRAAGDGAQSLVETSDGGYAIGGNTESFGDWAGDFWLVKTDAYGNEEWNQTYRGISQDEVHSMVQTSDGGYALAGHTGPYGGPSDSWLVKTSASGNMEWNRRYDLVGDDDDAFSIVQTSDGGYALAGPTGSDITGYWDFWLVKTNSTGHMEWNQTYGGPRADWPNSVVQTVDGGYAIAGYTSSFGAGGEDFWLVKTDAAGNVQWNRTYGGASTDYAWSVVQTVDGGYALAGYTKSFGAGDVDFWLVKTDSAGNAVPSFQFGLAWTDSTANTVTLYRGTTDHWWNYVRVRIWKIKENP